MDFGNIFPRAFEFTEDNFGSPYCFQLPIEDDSVLEEQEEVVTLLLSGGGNVAVKNQLAITIRENDGENHA